MPRGFSFSNCDHLRRELAEAELATVTASNLLDKARDDRDNSRALGKVFDATEDLRKYTEKAHQNAHPARLIPFIPLSGEATYLREVVDDFIKSLRNQEDRPPRARVHDIKVEPDSPEHAKDLCFSIDIRRESLELLNAQLDRLKCVQPHLASMRKAEDSIVEHLAKCHDLINGGELSIRDDDHREEVKSTLSVSSIALFHAVEGYLDSVTAIVDQATYEYAHQPTLASSNLLSTHDQLKRLLLRSR